MANFTVRQNMNIVIKFFVNNQINGHKFLKTIRTRYSNILKEDRCLLRDTIFDVCTQL